MAVRLSENWPRSADSPPVRRVFVMERGERGGELGLAGGFIPLAPPSQLHKAIPQRGLPAPQALFSSILALTERLCPYTPTSHPLSFPLSPLSLPPMGEIIASFELTTTQWLLMIMGAIFVGMSKTGVQGINNITIPVLAMIFDAKASTGILLPMLIMADLFGVGYYNRSAQWKHVFRLIPWAIAGVALGTAVGDAIPELWFKMLLGIILLGSLGLVIYMEAKKIRNVPDFWWFSAIMGILSGFTTMVGNAAGAVVAVYLLSMHLPKNQFIGTAAWFFMLINLSKIPFHVFVWKTIDWNILVLDLCMFPAIIIGAVSGVWIVKRISETFFRKFVIFATILSTVLMLYYGIREMKDSSPEPSKAMSMGLRIREGATPNNKINPTRMAMLTTGSVRKERLNSGD